MTNEQTAAALFRDAGIELLPEDAFTALAAITWLATTFGYVAVMTDDLLIRGDGSNFKVTVCHRDSIPEEPEPWQQGGAP